MNQRTAHVLWKKRMEKKVDQNQFLYLFSLDCKVMSTTNMFTNEKDKINTTCKSDKARKERTLLSSRAHSITDR